MSLKRGKISKAESIEIERLYKEGTPIEDIAEKLNRGLDPIFKLIKKEGFKRGEVKQQESFLVNRGSGKVVARPNTYVDDEIGKIDSQSQILKDKPLYQAKPVARGGRKTNVLVQSVCRVCGKTEKVKPVLSVDNEHTCSSCLRGLINK